MPIYRKNISGFTLIELLVVISIIALLSSVVLASLKTAKDKARLAAAFDGEARVHHVAADSTVGQWEFNEGSGVIAYDSSGYGNNGSFMGAPSYSTDTPNNSGYSLYFNGSSAVNVGSSTLFNLTNSFTITAWFKTTNLGNQIIVGKNHTSSYYLNIANNTYTFWTNGSNLPSGSAIIADGKWHHLIAVFDNTYKYVYIDGKIAGKGAGTISTDTSDLRIGNSGYNSAPFVGYIDGVRIYEKILSAQEAQRLYAESQKNLLLAKK